MKKNMINHSSLIYIAGHNGMVGSAIRRKLLNAGYNRIVVRDKADLDLREQLEVRAFFKKEKPDIVIDAAAVVGGILANNQYPYNFIMDNLQIQNNLIDTSFRNGVQKFIFLGSSCIYPKLAEQPLKEDYLLTGPLEPTNQWYALAKIAGLKLCEAINKQYGLDYISLMPTNLYGPNDNFDLESSHVVPAMIRKFHEAKEQGHQLVTLWGSGQPLREFMHVDDVASAALFALEHKLENSWYNVGTGRDLSIYDLAKLIQKKVGFKGEISWDSSKPDGTPRKLMDVSRFQSQGWKAKIDLEEGIEATYNWFLKNNWSSKKIENHKL